MDSKKYIIVSEPPIDLSLIRNDCQDLCVPTKKGESLVSILNKICETRKSSQAGLDYLVIGGTRITNGNNGTILMNNSGILGSYSNVPVSVGGTGLTSYSIGDILYASGPTTLSTLHASSDGKVLTLSGGIPSWQTPGGGSSSLTYTQIGFGDSSNLITSSNVLTFDGVNKLSLGNSDSYYGKYFQTIGSDGNDFYIYHHPLDADVFRIDGDNYKTLLNASNYPYWYTGIGLSNPQYPLHIFQSGTNTGYGIAQIALENPDSETGIAFVNTGPGGRYWNIFATNNYSGVGPGHFMISDISAGAYRFKIDAGGTCYIPVALNVSNSYTLPTSDGTSGYAMITDGAGNVSWQLPFTGSLISGSATYFNGDHYDLGGSPALYNTEIDFNTNGYTCSIFTDAISKTSFGIYPNKGSDPSFLINDEDSIIQIGIYRGNYKVGINKREPLSDLDIQGSFGVNASIQTTNYNFQSYDHTIIVDTAGNKEVYLPDPKTINHRIVVVKVIGGGSVRLHPYDTEKLEGASYLYLDSNYSYMLQVVDGNWYIIADHRFG